jgi:hypothetical protein
VTDNPIFRAILWIWAVAIWANVVLAVLFGASFTPLLIAFGVPLTAWLVFTSERGRRWMS